jgi:hypothetical protein
MIILLQSLGGKNKMKIKHQCNCDNDQDIELDVVCLPKKMFSWTNDFPDVECTDPDCTQVHHKDHKYFVRKKIEISIVDNFGESS